MVTPPLTIPCIEGEVWPSTSYKCWARIDEEADRLERAAVVLQCPIGHEFTLQRAVEKGLVSAEVADALLEVQRPRFEEAKTSIGRPFSPMPPDPEVVRQGWPCRKCGKLASKTASHAQLKERALCINCHTQWMNYGMDEEEVHPFLLHRRTWGRPFELYWAVVFERFLRNLPLLSEDTWNKILSLCRQQARRKRGDEDFVSQTATLLF